MKQEEVKCICPSFPWNPLKPFSHYDPSCPKTAPVCRGCEQILLAANLRVADGCPCNTKRGINHGLVPVDTCTCSACDPSESGSSRYCQPNHPARIVYPGKFLIQGSSGRPEEADATI